MEVDCHSVRNLIASDREMVLLDCREPDEWDLVRIDGAVLLPMSSLRDRVTELEKFRARTIVVYCHHGVRSLRVAHWLKQQGFPNACSMAGGIDAWSVQIDSSLSRY